MFCFHRLHSWKSNKKRELLRDIAGNIDFLFVSHLNIFLRDCLIFSHWKDILYQCLVIYQFSLLLQSTFSLPCDNDVANLYIQVAKKIFISLLLHLDSTQQATHTYTNTVFFFSRFYYWCEILSTNFGALNQYH